MTDILVIGGGIAGLSAAARLSAFAKVTVLEAETSLGYHASGRSAALIEKNYGAPSVQALNRASFDYLDHANGGYLSQRGLMIIAKEDERDAFEADVVQMGIEHISPAQAIEFVPVLDASKLAMAGYHADAHDIDTDRLMQDFARAVRTADGSVVTGARVTGINKADGVWHAQCGDDIHSAPTILNAAGAWADQVAALAGIAPIGLQPYRRSMARMPAPGGHDLRDWPLFFGVGESWYAKPDAGALLVSPAEEDPAEPHDAWVDDMVLAQGIARYQDMVSEPVTRLLSTWAGLRSFAPDRTLVLGPDPADPSFVWSAAQGGYGFQTSPAASQLVADLVNGTPSELPSDIVAALSPARFG